MREMGTLKIKKKETARGKEEEKGRMVKDECRARGGMEEGMGMVAGER